MTETTNTAANVAIEQAKPKREVSPQAKAALELHRKRAQIGTAILEIMEADPNTATIKHYMALAEKHMAEQAARKQEEQAARKANGGGQGDALAAYRAKANSAMALQEYLISTGVNVEDLLAKAAAAQAAA